MHILAFEKELSCHLYTFEGQFHIIYSFGKRPNAIFDMGTFSKRLLMLPIPKYAYVERHFCYSFTLCKVFLCHIFTHSARYFRATYIHIYTYHWKVFSMLPIFTHICIPLKGIFHATYIHIYTYHWKVFSMLPRCKVFLMGQPNSSKNPLRHVLIFMPFHIQNQNLDS